MATSKKVTKATKTDEFKKYSKLLGAVDYDHEAVEQLADALNEIAVMEGRVNQLRQLVKENDELHQFVWRTSKNLTVAIHNIDDDHLNNIMMHLLRNGRAIPRAIRGEAMKRELVIPATVSVGDWHEDREWQLARKMLDADFDLGEV